MNQPIVVTNIRIPQSEYRQIKSVAASMGVSVNEYIRKNLQNSVMEDMMAVDKKTEREQIDDFYKEMLDLAHSVPDVKVYDVSDDDAVIYGVYD